MGKAKSGNKRLMITLPEKLVDKLEQDTTERGLDLTKSARIQLALEKELQKSKHKLNNLQNKKNEEGNK